MDVGRLPQLFRRPQVTDGPCYVTWPHLPLHQPPPFSWSPSIHRRVLMLRQWQIKKKINLHLKTEEGWPKRHNRTMCDSVYLYRKKCDIDLYGENIVHWIYRMMFVFRVWVSDFVTWLEAYHWVFSWVPPKTKDTAFFLICKDHSVCFVLFLHRK